MARWSPEKTKTVVAVLLYLGPSCARAPGSGPAVDSTTTTDPLPSWNEGVPKSSILDFVARVTREGGSEFVPPAERIATEGGVPGHRTSQLMTGGARHEDRVGFRAESQAVSPIAPGTPDPYHPPGSP